ncbi:MAG TPA: tetratricopeptide repeat protein [Terriglobales bacterium]|jgi:tetratricopeptide (TPR) repeat protein|nr:tetratricopeptide repeat protein [Terriglobales bacterium]
MKRAAMIVVMLAMTSYLLAQQPGTQSPPPAKPGTAPSGTAQPSTTPPPAKHPPQAKTQPEFDAYKAAVAITDPAAFEKAADDFAAKFPDSELRVVLYRTAIHLYQSVNNGDKMLEMGRKVLTIDPDDPEALLGVAEVLAERTRDTDLDKEQRLDEAMKDAQRATETVDTDIVAPAETPQERVDAYKNFLRSTAYSIMGKLTLDKNNYAEAESYLRKSIDAYPSQPDPVAVLRLAVALDKQEKYPEALKIANRAVELTQENTPAGTVARQERDRLMKLTGSSPAPAAKPPAGDAQNQAPPKN